MNNLGKISVVLIAIFVAGNSMYPVKSACACTIGYFRGPYKSE